MNPEKYGFTVVESGMPPSHHKETNMVKPDDMKVKLEAMQKQIDELFGIIDELTIRVDEVAVRKQKKKPGA